MIPRLVLDTQVWLDLLLFGDPGCVGLGDALAAARWQVVIDPPCRDECRRVFGYPRFALPVERQQALLTQVDALCLAIDGAAAIALPRCRDPDDQKFISLAVGAGAALLLSRDKAVLALARRLRREHGITVLRPDDAEACALLDAARVPESPPWT